MSTRNIAGRNPFASGSLALILTAMCLGFVAAPVPPTESANDVEVAVDVAAAFSVPMAANHADEASTGIEKSEFLPAESGLPAPTDGTACAVAQSTSPDPPPHCAASCTSVAFAAYKYAMDQGFTEEQATELAFEVYNECMWLYCS